MTDDPAATLVYAGDGYKAFGAFTLEDVRARADELTAATGWGPTARVASVARGWTELARAMGGCSASTVGELSAEQVADFAKRVWVTPPSFLS